MKRRKELALYSHSLGTLGAEALEPALMRRERDAPDGADLDGLIVKLNQAFADFVQTVAPLKPEETPDAGHGVTVRARKDGTFTVVNHRTGDTRAFAAR